MAEQEFTNRGGYWLPRFPNLDRVLLLLVIDALLIFASLNFCFLFRFAGAIPEVYLKQHYAPFLPLFFVTRLGLFGLFGLYNWSFRYASIHDILRVVYASAVGSLIFIVARQANWIEASRFILINEFCMTLILIGGLRFSGRIYQVFTQKADSDYRAILVGRHDQVEPVVRDFMRNPANHAIPLAIVDKNPRRQGRMIHGVKVILPEEIPQTVQKTKANLMIIVGNTLGDETRHIIDLCRTHALQFRRLPTISGIFRGDDGQLPLQKVNPEDLLAREPVHFDVASLKPELTGKRILITGACGSIGSELVRQLIRLEPEKLILLDIHESALYLQERELEQTSKIVPVKTEFCDLKNKKALDAVFRRHHPHIVFHAAAHKHVPMMERFPAEAVINNVGGFKHVAECSIENDVERVIYISTDKAVAPSSIMGFTKRAGELLALAYAQRKTTKFLGVRFGNVLGSNGSVIPIFMKQIESGGPVTVTHPEMTRYFMTIKEAVQLVIQAGVLGQSAEIFVLDMGTPVKLVDFARELISISGRIPDEEIKIVYTGLRPGEKMHEELHTGLEPLEPFAERLFHIKSDRKVSPECIALFDELLKSAAQGNPIEIADSLKSTVLRAEGLATETKGFEADKISAFP
ncbi:MAG: nucleoside-diphosphate sugar epimerase/dehydratase [Verrucomicrobiota bacterium]|nr:nucleoside-diphosphate sugar epimerase/dehydratase [Verrucomicrobiota bacterium]